MTRHYEVFSEGMTLGPFETLAEAEQNRMYAADDIVIVEDGKVVGEPEEITIKRLISQSKTGLVN